MKLDTPDDVFLAMVVRPVVEQLAIMYHVRHGPAPLREDVVDDPRFTMWLKEYKADIIKHDRFGPSQEVLDAVERLGLARKDGELK